MEHFCGKLVILKEFFRKWEKMATGKISPARLIQTIKEETF